MDMCKELLESGGQIDVIYTDVVKAFDKVPHKRLIIKLYSYIINLGIIKLIESFLANRRQRVRINGFCSFWKEVLSRVPQSSIFGSLLFIIFINDLVDSCNYASELFLYADDAKLFRDITCNSDVALLLKDLLDIQLWLEKWLPKLNIKICKVVSYSHRLNFKIMFTYNLRDQSLFLNI